MPKYSVEVMTIEARHLYIRARSEHEAREIGKEIVLDTPPDDSCIYGTRVRQARDQSGEVDNWNSKP